MKKWNLLLVLIYFIPHIVNSTQIKIIHALYGLKNQSKYKDVTNSLVAKCNDKKECSFIVNNSLVGLDPYPGNIKRLKIVASCVQGSIEKKWDFEFKELAEVSLKCSEIHSRPKSNIIRESPYLTILLPGTIIGGTLGGLLSATGYMPEIPSRSEIATSGYVFLSTYIELIEF